MNTLIPVIDKFDGEYRWLSNFWPCEIVLEGESYPTVEHAYQTYKTDNMIERMLIRTAATPGIAKKLGKTVKLTPIFEQCFDGIPFKRLLMYECLRQKFSDPELRDKLIATGDAQLIEGNTWNDTYWGVCNGVGENHLGKLLMQIRDSA